MNFFLQLERKIILLFFLFVILTIVVSLFFYNNTLQDNIKKSSNIKDTVHDIINPKFTINNKNSKIEIKADKGNFINKNEILLINNVKFKSKKFMINSSKVLFDKKNQTAYSTNDSVFESKGTNINAKGFRILDKGNKIFFNGKTKLILTEK